MSDWPLEAGQGLEADSRLESPERRLLPDDLILAQQDYCRLLTSRTLR
jgi:hypothetical protein